jgi:ferrous iron transport protein A
MNNLDSLDNIDVGEKCIVRNILLEDNIKTRILDLGIIENTTINILYRSPFGNPTAYFVRGTVIALRNEDAKKIIVEREVL